MLTGVPVFLDDNIPSEYKTFKWKLKWYQIPFNKFKKYKIITSRYCKAKCIIFRKTLFIDEMIVVNTPGYKLLMRQLNKENSNGVEL
jgi:hypothetical protein